MTDKIAPVDYGFVPVDPDPDFDPEHNRKVMEETIANNEKLRARRNREYANKVGERTSAVSQYFSDLNSGRTDANVDQYFGPTELARLRGEQISNIIRREIGNATKQKALERAKQAKVRSL